MNKSVRIYFIGLLLSVTYRELSNPLLDTIPTLEFFGVNILNSSQLYSLQALSMLSLCWAAIRPRSAIAAFSALLSFGLFNAAAYSMVYAKGFNYLPHSENIHFFLIALVALRNLSQENRAWLTRAMIFVIGWPYFAAFLTKIRNVGFSWAWDETLPFYFETFSLISNNDTLRWLASKHSALVVGGTTTLLFESLALPGLLWKKTRRFTMGVALLFHAIVFYLFDIQFLLASATAFVLIWNCDDD